ncbi:YvrJ family protein [Zhurongbacter thermophilus]
MQDIISLITNLGFPIFVSVYLMAELSTKMGKLDSSIQKLSGEIALLKEVLRGAVETNNQK